MKRRDWQELLQCRTLRETQALHAVAERREHERQAAGAMASYQAMLAAEESRERSERLALHRSIQGHRVTPERLLHVSDMIAEGAARTAACEQDAQRAATAHAQAQDATEAARLAYRARRQAVERSRILCQRLGAAEARRAEIYDELESEEVETLIRRARGDDHA